MLLVLAASRLWAQSTSLPSEAEWTLRDFTFHTGEKLPEVRLHYTTLGKLSGNNAVLIMHGTTGHGDRFLSYDFGGVLFGPDQPLDASRYFIILPDAIGHGKSTKPSDGLRAHFPRYNYDDMVRAQYRLVREGLGVNHLRLVMGTSMGGMHTWLWGEMYPDFMDALMPLASAPVEIAGRNRILRRMIIDAIRTDPEWRNGDYTEPPHGIIAAHDALFMMTSSPAELHRRAPTRELSDIEYEDIKRTALASDANDMLYAFDASRDYNPAPRLNEIKALLYAVNSADDEVNPPELGILEREIRRVPHGRYILIPTSDQTRGHGTHTKADVWKEYLVELLRKSQKTN
jgi:homoserine O-acetyltransferase